MLLAGQRPGENAFAQSHGVAYKALIPVGGEPMIGRVARTLLQSPSIGRIVVLAQEPEDLLAGEQAWMADDPRISTSASGDGIASSIAAIAGCDVAPFPLVVTTADHALLTAEMVESFLAAAAGPVDVAVALVARETIEAGYPETRRTWLRFSDGDYSGANLFALRSPSARHALDLWATVEKDRKKAIRLMLRFGPLFALRALTRTISLDGALAAVAGKVGVRVKAVRLPFAEAAIDVDKPADLDLAERILSRRIAR